MRRSSFHLAMTGLFCAPLLLTGCASLPVAAFLPNHETTVVEEAVADEDLNELLGLMRHDLTANRLRERERIAAVPPQNPQPQTSSQRSAVVASLGRATASITMEGHSLGVLRMPVMGVTREELEDSWGAPRDGGSRRHRGIDIFAPRGTEVIAVLDGTISFIGEQPKGGRCLWLVTNDGLSFFYAHLDRWAAGLYEGMEVQTGDILGYVGNTGNAAHTPSHLHFSVLDNDEAVNPFYVLKYGRTKPTVVFHGGLVGTR